MIVPDPITVPVSQVGEAVEAFLLLDGVVRLRVERLADGNCRIIPLEASLEV